MNGINVIKCVSVVCLHCWIIDIYSYLDERKKKESIGLINYKLKDNMCI